MILFVFISYKYSPHAFQSFPISHNRTFRMWGFGCMILGSISSIIHVSHLNLTYLSYKRKLCQIDKIDVTTQFIQLCFVWFFSVLGVQLLINTAEHPGARASMQNAIQILRAMILKSTSALLKRCCRQAIQQLQFKSRPYPNLRFVR